MEPIAIIGLGCRFPRANDPDAFWRLLREGVDAISEVPPDRWSVERFFDSDPRAPGKMTTRWGGFLDDVRGFDPAFFGISRAEAVAMDPQQRLMLEIAFETLDDAGIPVERVAGSRTGVYTAFGMIEYCVPKYARPGEVGAYTNTGNIPCLIANRISYLLDLRGPSLSLDTACSSSLVAVHLACQALRGGECDLALAGGVNVMLSPGFTIGYSKLNAMSPSGRCHTFAAGADGYVRGEGGGLVLMKRLSEAIDDGDDVRAVILGSAINQDGRTNGLTAPNQFSQQDVLTRAYQAADVAPTEVQYVEAHGTGTLLGDPIEARALGAVLGQGRPHDRPCAIGSVKTNLGHLESAAGIAALIKVVLAIENGEVPASLHCDAPNPSIDFDALRLRVQTKRGPWSQRPRLAGVSGFGFGGSNAHVVLGEPPEPETRNEHRPDAGDAVYVLPLSAHSPQALQALFARYHTALSDGTAQFTRKPSPGGEKTAQDEAIKIADVCYSASFHRSQYDWRAGVVAASAGELLGRLDQCDGTAETSGVFYGRRRAGRRPKVAFVFTGQGAQYAGMGGELYETESVFRQAFAQCAEIADTRGDRALESVLFEDSSCLDQTQFTQPALFALEYALTRLWAAFGIAPDAVLGHSVGEYAAACAAGVMSVEDGMRLARDRAAIMAGLPLGGGMVAVAAGADQVASLLRLPRRDLDLAAVNSPQDTVIAGRLDSLEESIRVLEAAGIKVRRLNVSHAFHSSLMDPALGEISRLAQHATFQSPRIALISNVTGEVMREPPNGEYLARHARAPVRFMDGMKALYTAGCRIFVEIGPHPVLGPVGRRVLSDVDCRWIPSLQKNKENRRSIAEGLAALFASGVEIDWNFAYSRSPGRRVSLPLYPFQRTPLWDEHAPTAECYMEAGPASLGAAAQVGVPRAASRIDGGSGNTWREEIQARAANITTNSGSHPHDEASTFTLRRLDCPTPSFEGVLAIESASSMTDCRAGVLQVPEATWMAIAVAAYRECMGNDPDRIGGRDAVTISELRFESPLAAGEGERHKVQFAMPDGDGGRFEIHSRGLGAAGSPWRRHVAGRLSGDGRVEHSGPPLSDLRFRLRNAVEPDAFYAELASAGLELAASQRCITALRRRDGECLASVAVPTFGARCDAVGPLGVILMTAVCAVAAAAPRALLAAGQVAVPARFIALRWFGPVEETCHVHARISTAQAAQSEADVWVLDSSGRPLAEIACLTSIREARPTLFAGMTANSTPSLSAVELLRRLPLAQPPDRLGLVQTYLSCLVAGALGVPTETLDPHESVYRLGLDSLLIVSLRERIERELQVEVAAEQLVNQDLTPAMLASHLLERVASGS